MERRKELQKLQLQRRKAVVMETAFMPDARIMLEDSQEELSNEDFGVHNADDDEV